MPTFALTAVALVPAGLAMLTVHHGGQLARAARRRAATMRGRVMALYLVCFMGGTPLGAPIVGWLAETFGPRWGLVGGGLICVVSVLAIGGFVARRRGMNAGRRRRDGDSPAFARRVDLTACGTYRDHRPRRSAAGRLPRPQRRRRAPRPPRRRHRRGRERGQPAGRARRTRMRAVVGVRGPDRSAARGARSARRAGLRPSTSGCCPTSSGSG